MIEAYAIGVQAKLEDRVTPSLLKIIDGLERANTVALDLIGNLRDLSRAGLGLSRNLDKAAAGAAALGDTAGALTRASYVLDTMAATSADLARNMAAARAEGRSFGVAAAGGARIVAAGSGGGNSEPHGSHFARNATAAVGISAAYGLYESARLQDTNIRAAATSQVPFQRWVQTADELRAREFAYASKYAFATHGRIAPFGVAMLEASRLLRTLKPADQRILTDAAMPYAAVEAKLKGIDLPEALGAFIGLAHQAGAYTPAAATPLFESMMQASLTTHASLQQISRAASYALPSLHAAGANSSDVMLMLATMMQAGILNTKSGTWLNDMAQNALPNALGSGLFTNKRQNAALTDLGLYRGGKSMFYRHGQFDLMAEVSLLAQARQRMGPLAFNAATRQAFGLQGQRAAALFAEPQVLANLHALGALTSVAQSPFNVAQAVNTFSTVAKADQTIANANITLMNASQTLMGPANAALSGLGSFFGWSAKFTGKHPVVGGIMDAGLAIGGATLLKTAWKGVGMSAEFLGKTVIGGLLGAAWKRLLIPAFQWAAGPGTDALITAAMEGSGAFVAASAALTGGLTAALGVALGDLLKKPINDAINGAAHMLGAKGFNLASAIGGGVYDWMHGTYNPNAGDTHVHVHLGDEEVRHFILRGHMPATPSHGQQGVNPLHSPLSPGLNYAPGL